MIDHSTQTWFDHLFDVLIADLVFVSLYRRLLFRTLPDTSLQLSSLVFWGLVFLVPLLNTFVVFRYRKGRWSALVSALLPLVIYNALAYRSTLGLWVVSALGTALVLFVLYTLYWMLHPIHCQARGLVYRSRLHRCLCFGQSVSMVCLLLLIPLLIFPQLTSSGVLNASTAAVSGTSEQPQTVRGNIDTLLLLQEDQWDTLTAHQRLNVLQTVANIEASYFGLNHELNVAAANLEEDVLGCYSDDTHTIRISLPLLEETSAHTALTTLCHEAFHAYEHRLADHYNTLTGDDRSLLLYAPAARYAAEFANYADSSEDFWSYYTQDCETDSRAYASYAVQEYYDLLDEYLNSNDSASDASSES